MLLKYRLIYKNACLGGQQLKLTPPLKPWPLSTDAKGGGQWFSRSINYCYPLEQALFILFIECPNLIKKNFTAFNFFL